MESSDKSDSDIIVEYLNGIKDSDMILDLPEFPKKKKSRRRQKDELAYLRQRVDEMHEKLVTLQAEHKTKRACSSPWESEAREQALKRQKAQQENALLKKSLEEHVELAQELQYVLSKRPNLSLFPFVQDEEWKLYHLVADPIKRVHGMHAIADREYEKLSCVLLESGLDQLTTEFHGIKINDGEIIPLTKAAEMSFQSGIGNGLEMEILRHRTIKDLPFNALVEAAWRIFKGRSSSFGIKELETFGDDLVYVQALCSGVVKYGGAIKQSNLVMKRYRETTRDVFVWRGVFEDEKYPLLDDNMRCADTGWFVIENQTDGKEPLADVKLILRVRPPIADTTEHLPPGVVIESMVSSALKGAEHFRYIIEHEVKQSLIQENQYLQASTPP